MRYDSDTLHHMFLNDFRFDRCPECGMTAVRGESERRCEKRHVYHEAPTMITYIYVCPEHTVIVHENDDWGGKTFELVSDEVKYA